MIKIKIRISKIISNVNYGLLEKGRNKVQKSFIFESLEELQHYKAKYGGNISILQKHKIDLTNLDDDDTDNEDNYDNNDDRDDGKNIIY